MTICAYVLTDGRNTVITYPYTIQQMIDDNPTVSFPLPCPDSIAAEYNTFPVEAAPQPTYNPMTQNLNQLNPVKQGGVWYQEWSVTEATPEEQAERLAQFRANLNCTPLQGKLELDNRNLLDAAEAAVASGDKTTKLAWANATIWLRTSPMIETLGTSLGLSPTDLDDLFVAARQIYV